MNFKLLVELLSLAIVEVLGVGGLGWLVGLALVAQLLIGLVRFGFILVEELRLGLQELVGQAIDLLKLLLELLWILLRPVPG